MAGKRREKKIKRDFLSEFGRLRAGFRSLKSEALIDQIVRYINDGFDISDLEHMKKAPWVQLLLIKWILIDPDYGKGKSEPNTSQVNALLNQVWALQGKARLPTDFPNANFFMRAMANQQLDFQINFSYTKFARQRVLFSKLPENHTLKTRFKETTGLSIGTYLELAFALVAFIAGGAHFKLTLSSFSALESQYSADEIEQFLESLSMNKKVLIAWLKEVSPQGRSSVEYYLETPFYSVPLLKSGPNFLCWYPTVLYRSIEDCIYDKLKAIDSQSFMDKFGTIFENYMEEVLENTGAFFLKEEKIKELMPGKKCVDFVIAQDEHLIFIDAKGVELSDDARSTHLPELIKRKTKNSILKAIEQSYSVYENLELLGSLLNLSRDDVIPYVLVVTHKEHYLGDGEVFSGIIAADKISKIKQDYPSVNIPEHNMYFITIDEFDQLAESVRTGKTTFVDFMKQVMEADREPSTKKFSFQLHLESLGCNLNPEHLMDVNDEVLDNLAQAFPEARRDEVL